VTAEATDTFDPFDPDKLRVVGTEDLVLEKLLLTVPVRKPRRQEFFRVHAGEGFSLDCYVLVREAGMDREVYMLAKELWAPLVGEAQLVRLFTCVTKGGTVFLWPARLPEAEGAASASGGRRWQQSALEAADEAKKHWVRMIANKELGAYEVLRARGDLGEPGWPADKTFRDFLKVAFKDNLIDTPHHDALRELYGEF
jgi:hypothetical protein